MTEGSLTFLLTRRLGRGNCCHQSRYRQFGVEIGLHKVASVAAEGSRGMGHRWADHKSTQHPPIPLSLPTEQNSPAFFLSPFVYLHSLTHISRENR